MKEVKILVNEQKKIDFIVDDIFDNPELLEEEE